MATKYTRGMPHPKFKVGDKVRIVEGGWGIHPEHVGKIVTIHSIIKVEHDRNYDRYTTEETLTNSRGFSAHTGKISAARGASFELITSADFAQQIREINEQIKAKDAEHDAILQAKEALKAERQRLIAALLKELDV